MEMAIKLEELKCAYAELKKESEEKEVEMKKTHHDELETVNNYFG